MMRYQNSLVDLAAALTGDNIGQRGQAYNSQHLKPYAQPDFPQRQSAGGVLPRNWYEADDSWRAAYADALKHDPNVGSFENFIRMQRFMAGPAT
jgi:hypothetical protein